MALPARIAHAATLPPLNDAELTAAITRLKNDGASLPTCIAFVQANRRLNLHAARQLTLALPVFSAAEQAAFAQACRNMQAELDAEA